MSLVVRTHAASLDATRVQHTPTTAFAAVHTACTTTHKLSSHNSAWQHAAGMNTNNATV
jgi:hypothetical protein